MSTSIALWDIVRVGKYCFLERIIPLKSDFNRDPIVALRAEMENSIKWGFILIEKLDKGPQTPVILKLFTFSRSFIGQIYSNT